MTQTLKSSQYSKEASLSLSAWAFVWKSSLGPYTGSENNELSQPEMYQRTNSFLTPAHIFESVPRLQYAVIRGQRRFHQRLGALQLTTHQSMVCPISLPLSPLCRTGGRREKYEYGRVGGGWEKYGRRLEKQLPR